MNTFFRAFAAVMVALILVLGGFAGGFFINGHMTGAAAGPLMPGDTDAFTAQLQEVRDILDKEALEPPDETSATAGAIQGLLESSGDQYATFFDAEHYGFFNEQTMGAFGGIGVTLGEKDGTAYVIEVFPDTPADEAGVQPDDKFYSIDGVTREKWTSDEVVKRVRGEEGTVVKIGFVREGEDEPVVYDITRAMIDLPNTMEERFGDVAWVRMGSFNAKSADELSEAIQKAEDDGAQALIVDLRDNPGGLLNAAVDVSSLFIERGVVVQVEERNATPVEYRTTRAKITDLPMVVLVNENSASASEIFAGAMQDYERAAVVGVTTFGKGSVQSVEELSNGGAVKFTTAHYLTPKGRVIDGEGVEPDVEVKMDAMDQADPETDTQLQRAIDYLEEQL